MEYISLTKTKVAPIQPVSILSLELLSYLLLAESVEIVLESLRASLTIRNIICWSDSLDTLHWIKGAHKKWKLFIQNKVEKIRKLTNVNMWRYCPGNLNPADLPSRGTTATDFYNFFSEWNNGLTFLHQSINAWPMNISVTNLSTSEDNKVVNVVGSIS